MAEGLPAAAGDEAEGEDGERTDGHEEEAGALGKAGKHVAVGSVCCLAAPRAG
jgi:hypothetical protein